MDIKYYLTIFPTEALIASQLEPEQFGSYMAIGSRKGSEEQLIFARLSGEFGEDFDWEYARGKCVPHANGDPKHSVYLGVYRVLEKIPQDAFQALYLTTRDGRSLRLSPAEYAEPRPVNGVYVYHQFCPMNPVIVSVLPPREFGLAITDTRQKISVPSLVFGDMKAVNMEDPENTGNLGDLYDNRMAHYLDCISSVKSRTGKQNKTYTRSHLESFTYNSLGKGLYLAGGGNLVYFPMPGLEELKQKNYDWGRSALIF